ncbi:YceD family protein [Geodermatophilus sp. YIM 151500]|uniref:YceD family protein n=1 Tax=Geodermatophilus sp. YIM 151500 TaxID=2984531 RepID=UPI0021E4B1A6|nr:YceD family protein [Geodermatophilus sp. YIM 151500]MCV2488934.1 YceD family protein [Geodermatophilus sp. YIM 151500]
MPAASPHRPGAAPSDARRPRGVPSGARRSDSAASGARPAGARRAGPHPWVVELRELGRCAGSMQQLERTLPAPPGWGVELIGVPEGGEVRLDLRLESVMEGVLVSGEVDVPVTGSCARCLDAIEDSLVLDVQELFAYEGSTTEATSEEDEVRLVEGERIDLEPMVRDAVVLALPLAPLCTDECAGLCADCGQRLDDLPPDHSHDQLDPRWAGLAARVPPSPDASGGDNRSEEN